MQSVTANQGAAARTPPLPQRELGLVVGTQAAYGFCWSMFLLLPKFLTTELHASPSQIGVLSAIPSFAGALAVPFVGRLVDRGGRRRLIMLGSALVALQAFGFMAVDRIGPLLYVLQFFYGLSFVIVFNAAGTHAADLAPPARLSQVLGVFGAANVAMNAVAPAIGEPLASAVGWKSVFALAGVMGVCALLLSLRIHDVDRAHVGSSASSTDNGRGAVVLYALCMCGAGAAFAAAFAFYQPFALSLGMHQLRGFFIGFASSVVLARVGLGSLPDRLGRKRTAVAALALYAVVEVAMSRLAPGTLVLYGALLGCAHGFFYPAVNALAVEACDPRQRGTVMTYINGGFQVGYTLGVLAFGWIAQRAGYPAIFMLGGLVVAIAAAALARGAPKPVHGASW
jgi:MFS family permease